MSHPVDVAIIGAGPYGLSIAAHLNATGLACRVFGIPMESWAAHMPPGMHLKSDPICSSLFEPTNSLTLELFSRERRIDYHHYNIPVKLEHFVDYGRAFQQRFVPQVEPRKLVALNTATRGYQLDFAHGETVLASHVVVATGVVCFRHLPTTLSGLPAELVSHSCDYGPMNRLRGKEVAVVGAGSSALDIAALLSMQKCRVTLIARPPRLQFQPVPAHAGQTLVRRALRRLFRPPSHGLGDGWLMRLCADTPELVHLLPDRLRLAILSNTLGPSGGYFVREKIERDVVLKLDRRIESAQETHGRLTLNLAGSSGARESISADHVVAATGYRVDLGRLDFLGTQMLAKIRTTDRAPVLSVNFESSAPGVYFAGLAAARSFGPALRFVMGAVHPARRLSRYIPQALSRELTVVPVEIRSSRRTRVQ